MAPYYFCTYFDRNYLSRGLALISSLRAHCPEFRLSILCLDEEVFRALETMALADVTLIGLSELEAAMPVVATAKRGRSTIEYYFTLTPALMLFALDRVPPGALLTYLDADLYFYADPKPIFDEAPVASILIVEHRFPDRMRHLEQFGRFNVGWVSIRADGAGRRCAVWWRDRCAEWCFDHVDGERFADQKYLDAWPKLFEGVHVVLHPGADVGPWNLGRHELRRRHGRVEVDGRPLLFFHFHGMRRRSAWLVDLCIRRYGGSANRVVRGLYRDYMRLVEEPTLVAPAGELPRGDAASQAQVQTSHRLLHWTKVARDVVTGRQMLSRTSAATGRSLR
jgi:hypothetical protein